MPERIELEELQRRLREQDHQAAAYWISKILERELNPKLYDKLYKKDEIRRRPADQPTG